MTQFNDAITESATATMTQDINDGSLLQEAAKVCLKQLQGQALSIVEKLDGQVSYASEEAALLHTVLGNVTRTVVALECLIAKSDQDALHAHENEQMILAAQEISRQVGQHF